MLTLTQNETGQKVTMKVGDELAIELAENASTGYTWTIDSYDQAILDSLGSDSSYPAGPPGSGGQTTFTFRGIAAGTGEIRLKNWRAWEGDASVVERFKTSVTVQ